MGLSINLSKIKLLGEMTENGQTSHKVQGNHLGGRGGGGQLSILMQTLPELLPEARGGGGQTAASCVSPLSLVPDLPLIPSHFGFTD